MAHDVELAKRIKAKMAGLPILEQKKIFGGVGFLLKGKMACGVNQNNMIVRIDPEKHVNRLTRVDMTGRPMKGRLVIGPEACKADKQLSAWIKEGVDFALTLPKKKK